MYEDPQDRFREMELLFFRLFTQMNREFATGEPPVVGFYVVIPGGGEPSLVPGLHDIPHRGSTEPVAEVHRMGNEVKVITELPGITKEGIRLNLEGSVLKIDAGNGHAHYHTIATMPRVDPGSKCTSVENGILEVTFELMPVASEENNL